MPFTPSWNSLKRHVMPKWLQDAKFGIYTHWGPYCVPAFGPNATWYPIHMYHPGTEQYEYHRKTFGPQDQFGYKDFIPMMTGERFDPDEWAELFADAGARFAGPVGEHHDGFCMWDTAYSDWNAAKMGPKRDVVGELEKSIRRQNMKFLVALHHAENWWFYPHWDKNTDCADPRFSGLYGEPHNLDGTVDYMDWHSMQQPGQAFLDRWLNKIKELVDHYSPDVIWYDFGLEYTQEHYKREAVAYYYQQAEKLGRDVSVMYKFNHLAPGSGMADIEQGGLSSMAYNTWITDTTVDDGAGWGYLNDTPYKTPGGLIRYLADNVSKNGAMLLNVGPDRFGQIPEQAKSILRDMGKWLRVNGEAIYDTTAWLEYGEGPTKMVKEGTFNETALPYTNEDFRFTSKGDTLYAVCMNIPKDEVTIKTLYTLYPQEIKRVTMLGGDGELPWTLTHGGLRIGVPDSLPCEHCVTFKIERKHPFSLL